MTSHLRAALALALVASLACTPAPQNAQRITSDSDEAASAAPAGPATEARQEAPAATSPEDRVGNSWALLFETENGALRSHRLEVTGSAESWDRKAGAVERESYTYKIDTAGKDRHFLKTSAKAGAATVTTESYLMNDGEEAYAVVNGRAEPSFGFEMLELAFLPISIGLPIAFASMGTSAAGQDRVDGRLADKFSLDSAKAPVGAVGAMNMLLSLRSAKGTVWVDRDTGALLKATMEYKHAFIDPPGSGTVVAEGTGRFELGVSRVGKVSVALPN